MLDSLAKNSVENQMQIDISTEETASRLRQCSYAYESQHSSRAEHAIYDDVCRCCMGFIGRMK